jgi:hypothetical protein
MPDQFPKIEDLLKPQYFPTLVETLVVDSDGYLSNCAAVYEEDTKTLVVVDYARQAEGVVRDFPRSAFNREVVGCICRARTYEEPCDSDLPLFRIARRLVIN